MDKTANQVFEGIPSTESCTGIIVDSEETEGEGIHIYLSQLKKSLSSPGTRAIIKMDKQQARTLIEILQRALELENKGNDMVEVGIYGLCCPNRP